MCTCERFLVGVQYRTKKKRKGENENWNEPFFLIKNVKTLILFFFTAKTYIKQVYLEESGQIRYIW